MIDGAALVHMNVPDITSKTFGDYCDTQITNKIKQLAQNVSRLDVVLDVYKRPTLKQDTSKKERKGKDILFTGQGGRRHVTSKAKQRTATHFSTSRQKW